jgi:hypothetical protein
MGQQTVAFQRKPPATPNSPEVGFYASIFLHDVKVGELKEEFRQLLRYGDPCGGERIDHCECG